MSLALSASCAHAAVHTCDPTRMGARADGHTKDTVAVQKAIDACAASGGGEVLLSAGIFLSGPLDLKSYVHLRIAKGVILLGSADVEDYAIRTDASWRRVSLIHADKAVDIGILGEGTVDGQGQGWWRSPASPTANTSSTSQPSSASNDFAFCYRSEPSYGIIPANIPLFPLTRLLDASTRSKP
jgi:polygalacturonase